MRTHPRWKRRVAGAILLIAGLWGGALLLLPGGSAGAAAGAPRVGEPAPDFALAEPDGQPVRLSDLRGRPVILNFWATWCPPCRDEMPDLEAAYRHGEARGLAVVGVNVGESAVAITAFRQRFDLTFPLLADTDGKVVQLYRVIPLPTTYLIDRQGVIRDVVYGRVSGERLAQWLAGPD